jgi:hypothetical protein
MSMVAAISSASRPFVLGLTPCGRCALTPRAAATVKHGRGTDTQNRPRSITFKNHLTGRSTSERRRFVVSGDPFGEK